MSTVVVIIGGGVNPNHAGMEESVTCLGEIIIHNQDQVKRTVQYVPYGAPDQPDVFPAGDYTIGAGATLTLAAGVVTIP